jgi:SAM-dependent methyltransferase
MEAAMSSIPKIFDRNLVARHLARRPQMRDDFVARLVLGDLEERIGTLKRVFRKALVLGPDAGLLPQEGRTSGGRFAFERVVTLSAASEAAGELPPLPGRDFDLIVSLMDLQIVDDVPGYLAQLARHLAPDGLLLAAALGGESLTELRRAFLAADAATSGGAYARVAPFIPLRDGGALLQRAGLALPVADVETHVVRYANPVALMQELKALGASNPLADRPGRMASRRLLAEASVAYQEIAGDADGKVRATLEILWLSGWAPHESQQKPLKPGSATVSLKSVLRDKSGKS